MMSKGIASKFTVVGTIVIVGLLLLFGSFYAWWRLIYSNPTHVFDRMLSTSLATPSVSKTVNQSDESQKLDQTSALVTQPEQMVQIISVLEQADDSTTRITTESIATPTADYVRYNHIKTGQKNSQGQDYNFSSVLGIWGKSTDDQASGGNVQLFNQTVLGVVPIASIRQPIRSQLLDQIRKDGVYDFDSAKVKRQTINGRPVYSYDVSIKPVTYVKMLKSFASAMGMTQLEQVDPAQYENSAPLQFVFDIDVWSSQIRKITYVGTDRAEKLNSFGALFKIEEPATSIGVEELQTRLQQVQ